MSGYLLDCQWHEGCYDTAATAGEFFSTQAAFRSVATENSKDICLAESGLHRRTSR
jgi:glutathionyl-hydroquinone reductase